MTQIKVRGNKKIDDLNRNNVIQGDVNRGIIVYIQWRAEVSACSRH